MTIVGEGPIFADVDRFINLGIPDERNGWEGVYVGD